MSKNRIVFILGSVVLVLPYLGFPSSWERVMLFVVGLLLISLSFSVSAQKRKTARIPRRPRKAKDAVFVEGYNPLDHAPEDTATKVEDKSGSEDSNNGSES